MRRLLALLCAGLSTALLTGAGQPAPQRLYQAYSDEQKAALDRVSAYLNGIRTLKSGFIQIGPNGESDEGDIYISKPGQVRFDYHAPSPVLIVATGGAVYVKNARLNTVDKYDLSDTPLGLLLNAHVDLKTNKAVVGVREQDGGIIVNARTSSNRNDSNITLVFAAQPMELRQWTVRDNQGGTTTVALRGLQPGAAVLPETYAVPVKAPSVRQAH
jgi:outer membrane lipoprotein-sorting protein